MEPFKNLFNKKLALKISKSIKKEYSDFDQLGFLKKIENDLLPLELKERVALITLRLHLYLPKDPLISIPILLKALKNSETNPEGLAQFEVWPLTHFVALYGIDTIELSLNALKEMTKVFTSEFAVRSFLIKDELKTLNFLKNCLKDESEHVRRFASEGSRPLLPWGQKLNSFVENPEKTWSLLEKLKNDPSEYVRKSVANHINDHSKNHPEFVIEKLLKWHHQKNKTKELTWVIKHASRSLIKKGYKKAFLLHGVENVKIKLMQQKIIRKKINLGEKLLVVVELKNLSSVKSLIIIDHEIHLLKANGLHTVKVFKGKKLILDAKERQVVEMKIPLNAVTTRVYYNGEHYWNVLINGERSRPLSFDLESD
jgi:3-methyladenine DNA glycosylase AlkC